MSTRYLDYFYSYLKETSYGVKAYVAADTFYKFGNHPDPYEGLSTTFEPVGTTTNASVEPTWFSGKGSVEGPITFDLINGIPLFMALGKAANTTPSYEKHVITPQAKGTALNSYLIHREMAKPRGTSDWAQDFFGCKVDQLDIVGLENQAVKCHLKFIGSSEVAGTVLDDYPVPAPTAVTTPFRFNTSTMTWNVTEQAELKSFRFTYRNGLKAKHTHRATTPEWCEFLDRADQIGANCSLGFVASEHAILDDLLAQTKRTFYFDLIRTAASDEIKITFSNCLPTSAKYPIPGVKEACIVAVVLNPSSTSIEVRDAIGSAYYT